MAKHLIKITRDYATKNRVQELCLISLKELDHSLCANLSDAKKLIKKRYNDAIASYSGRAKLPELKDYEPDDNTTTFYIEEVVYIDIYEVLNDFSH